MHSAVEIIMPHRGKAVYLNERDHWDEIVLRDMAKDVSWEVSAKAYLDLYRELSPIVT